MCRLAAKTSGRSRRTSGRRLGIGYAPEDRRLFSAFTVEENILLPARVAKLDADETKRRLDRAYSVLPELAGARRRVRRARCPAGRARWSRSAAR